MRPFLDPSHLAGVVTSEYHAHRERQQMRLSLRLAVQVGVLFLVVRVLVDLATPLLPGAFRLDPNESVVVAGTSYQLGVNATTVQPSPIARHAACTSPGSSGSVQPSEPRVARHLCTSFPRLTYLTEPTASTSSPDDD